MMKRLKKLFVILFFSISLMPLVFVNWQSGAASGIEKRTLANFPSLFIENSYKEKEYNRLFCKQLSAWFDDSIGFRNGMVAADALIRYYIFNEIKDMPLGNNGELAPYANLDDYQHKNLLDESAVERIVDAYATIAEYLKERDIQVYYVQCWDKHTIYPEQYKDNIQRFGDVSLVDQVEQALIQDGSMNVVPIKEELMHQKEQHDVYGTWSEPWHWNQRGAFVCYRRLIEEINRANADKYVCLSEQDFEITMEDKGQKLFGVLHRQDIEEVFHLKDKNAVQYPDGLTFIPKGPFSQHTKYFVNKAANNDDTLLILGDSYFHDYGVIDYLAESFRTTLMFNASDAQNGQFEQIIDTYKPNIVIFENAERASSRFFEAIEIAEALDNCCD